MATVRKAAPPMIKAIMQVVMVAAVRLSTQFFQPSAPVALASRVAPATPITAASVGEAMPA